MVYKPQMDTTKPISKGTIENLEMAAKPSDSLPLPKNYNHYIKLNVFPQSHVRNHSSNLGYLPTRFLIKGK